MEALLTWLGENGKALWTTIITFLSVYGVALIGLIIAIIKIALSKIANDNKRTAEERAMINGFIDRIDSLEQRVIEASNINTEKRIEAMKEIANAANITNEQLEEATEVKATEALESLD